MIFPMEYKPRIKRAYGKWECKGSIRMMGLDAVITGIGDTPKSAWRRFAERRDQVKARRT